MLVPSWLSGMIRGNGNIDFPPHPFFFFFLRGLSEKETVTIPVYVAIQKTAT